MDKIFFSIVIPTFNEEKNIMNCILSIRACYYPNDQFEIIIVDNGSTDRTVEIAQQLGVIVLIDKTKTIGGLRNLGAEIAKGTILVFLDADCTVSEQWLAAAEEVFKDNENIGLTGSRLLAPEKGTWIEKAWISCLLSKSPIKGNVAYVNSGNCFVRKIIFEKINGFSETITTDEDVDLCERIRKIGSTIYYNSNIAAIHWGYPKTLSQYIRREIWHGLGDVKRNLLSFWKSKPTMLALYNLMVFLLLFVSIWTVNKHILSLVIIMFICPPLALTALTILKIKNYKDIFKIFLLYFLYGIARLISLIWVLTELVWRKEIK